MIVALRISCNLTGSIILFVFFFWDQLMKGSISRADVEIIITLFFSHHCGSFCLCHNLPTPYANSMHKLTCFLLKQAL